MRDQPDARESSPQLIENINAIVKAMIVVMALIVMAKSHKPEQQYENQLAQMRETLAGKFFRARTLPAKQT